VCLHGLLHATITSARNDTTLLSLQQAARTHGTGDFEKSGAPDILFLKWTVELFSNMANVKSARSTKRPTQKLYGQPNWNTAKFCKFGHKTAHLSNMLHCQASDEGNYNFSCVCRQSVHRRKRSCILSKCAASCGRLLRTSSCEWVCVVPSNLPNMQTRWNASFCIFVVTHSKFGSYMKRKPALINMCWVSVQKRVSW